MGCITASLAQVGSLWIVLVSTIDSKEAPYFFGDLVSNGKWVDAPPVGGDQKSDDGAILAVKVWSIKRTVGENNGMSD